MNKLFTLRLGRKQKRRRRCEKGQEFNKNAKIVKWNASGVIPINVCEIFQCWFSSSTHRFYSFCEVWIDWMINIEVLDEQWLNSCWLSISVVLVDWIRIFKLFFESNILVIEVINNPKWLGWDPWKFRGFRDENGEEKWKAQYERPWGAAPTRAPQNNLCSSNSVAPHQQETKRIY